MNYFEDEEPFFFYNDTLDGRTDKVRKTFYNDS